MKKRVLSLLVDNTSGVLSRVAGLFSRRGYNIDSLTVGETADPRYSRMTVVVNGDQQILDQITKQLAKLVDVVDIKQLAEGESVTRELVLVKVRVGRENRQDVMSIANIFRAKIIDVGVDSLIIELTGTESKIEAFFKLLGDYEILELARTGMTGLSRGAVTTYHSAICQSLDYFSWFGTFSGSRTDAQQFQDTIQSGTFADLPIHYL